MSEQPSESGGGNGGAAKGRCTSFKAVDWKKVWARISKFIVTNFLPLSFLVAIVWALAWPAPGKACIEVTVSVAATLTSIIQTCLRPCAPAVLLLFPNAPPAATL
jgi:hypothetical protein